MKSPTDLISWNVNGLRAVLKKGFDTFIKEQSPDIICLQETKISSDLIADFNFDGYPFVYWNCAKKKGYSGTAILCKCQPISVQYGMGISKHDAEGRIITAEFNDFYLVNVLNDFISIALSTKVATMHSIQVSSNIPGQACNTLTEKVRTPRQA